MTNIKVIVYSSGLTVAAQATDQAIDRQGMEFTTYYPGGLYGTCSFFVAVPFTGSTEFRQGRRVAVFSGIKMIWEGEIDSVVHTSTRGQEGIKINCSGKWGSVLNKMRWDKVWCDTSITQGAWPRYHAGNRIDIYSDDRTDGLSLIPKSGAYAQYAYGAFKYDLPAGQTVARFTCDYDFQESTQVWRAYVYDTTNAAIITGGSVVTSGTGSWDVNPSAGCAGLQLRLVSDAAQTVADEMLVYVRYTNIKVYGETGTISASEVVKDVRHQLSLDGVLAIDESLIGTNNQVFEPCIMEGETYAEFLSRIASFGDTSLNPWAIGIDTSQNSLVADYLPMMYFEQQPSLADYEYKLRLDDIENGVKIELPYYEVKNYVILEYTDINGDKVRVTPEDDANLTDTDSVSVYGRKDAYLRLGSVGSTEANNYARRYLDWFKEPHPRMTSPIQVRGYIRAKSNLLVPVHEVRAGKRVLIENYLQEIGGAGLIFIITETRYNEDSGVLTISAGSPEPLEVVAARRSGL